MKWVPSWSYLPIEHNVGLGCVENETQRLIVENNLSGSKIRVKFTNLYSKEALVLNRVTIGLQKKQESSLVENIQTITYKDQDQIVLGAGEEGFSDEISLDITHSDRLVVSVYIEKKTIIETVCQTWSTMLTKVINSDKGDFTRVQDFSVKSQAKIFDSVKNDINDPKSSLIYGVTEVQVLTDDLVKVVAAFGDSITHMSFWSEPLAKRLYDCYPGKVTLINRGIGGNRLLRDPLKLLQIPGGSSCFGKAGVRRFEHDVYGGYRPDSIIILEGINDIMHPFLFDYKDEIVTPEELVKGYCLVYGIAREYGSKVFIGTITPCGSLSNPSIREIEEIRQMVNQWIRKNTLFDGYIDFDEAVVSEKDPAWMEEGYHMGDGLHPNQNGGEKMAQIICVEKLLE